MMRRISIALVVSLLTTLLPVQVFAEDSHPLASLRTADGLQKALQSSASQDVMRQAPNAAQVARQQQATPFFSSSTGKVTVAAVVAVALGAIIYTWNKPGGRTFDQRNN